MKSYPFWKPFSAMLLMGIVGIFSLLFISLSQIDQLIEMQPELAEMPLFLLAMLILVQPTILLIAAVAIGCLAAPRVGLVSLVYEKMAYNAPWKPRLLKHVGFAAGLGLFYAVVVTLLDHLFLPSLGEEFHALQEQTAGVMDNIAQLGMGILYGGITEELLLRWGVMALFVWLGWRLAGRPSKGPSRLILWGAIVFAAVLFGIGHLPAMASMVSLTGMIIFRTILLNALGGVIFGWLFWRYSLEVAMVAHGFTHVGFFLITIFMKIFI